MLESVGRKEPRSRGVSKFDVNMESNWAVVLQLERMWLFRLVIPSLRQVSISSSSSFPRRT